MSVLKKLNSARAEAMQVAADTNSGGMVSVLGLELTAQKVAQLCEEASKNTKEKGTRKILRLAFLVMNVM